MKIVDKVEVKEADTLLKIYRENSNTEALRHPHIVETLSGKRGDFL